MGSETNQHHIPVPTTRRRAPRAAVLLPLLALVLAAAPSAAAQPPDETVPDTTTTTTTTTTPGDAPTRTAPTTTQVPATAPDADPADPDDPVEDPPGDDPVEPEEPGPEPEAPVTDDDGDPIPLPTGPPPGYTEDQFRTFVDVVTACGPEPGVVCSRILAWTGNRTLAEMSQWVVEVPVRIAIVIGIALLANWLVRRSLERYLRRLAESPTGDDPDRDARRALRMETASTTLGGAATTIISVIAGLVALGQLNINIGPLLAGAGIAGVALGFGAQTLVRDILAGFFVIAEDQYGIGDFINAGPASGKVEGISLRVTKLRDVEGTLWFIPNGEISEVGNMTQRWARVILDVDVAYGSDHHEASKLIKEAADAMWQDPEAEVAILEEPELWGVEALGDSAVTIRIAVKCAPADQWKAARRLRSRIKDRFDEEGIEIPFPQQTVWIRSADAE